MTHYITMSDNDVLYMDDETGNIIVNREKLPPRIDEGEAVFIRFHEDPDTIQHKFTVVECDDSENIVTLDYVEQLGEDLLIEAPKFVDKLKKIFNPDQATKIAAGEKAAEKAEKKQAKKFADLLKRDVAEGTSEGLLFYIELPDGQHLKTPMEFKDVALFYKDGNNLNPAIVNAVVTLAKPSDFIMRQGKKDFEGTGTRFETSYFNVPNNMKDAWDKEDIKRFEEILKSSTKELKTAVKKQLGENAEESQSEKNSAEETNNAETSAENKPEETKNNTRYDLGISSNTYKHFLKILHVMKPKLYDAFDKPVDVSNINELATKVKYNNLADFEIEIDGKRTPAINWIKTAVKNKVLMEKVLNEAPQILFSPEDTNNPDEINLKKIIQRETEKEQRAEAEKAEAAKQAEFREKYASIYEELKTRVNEHEDTIDILEYLFENMVPSSGVAETMAGEYVRAMMRILYRDYNDGDKFFTGYGIETCGSSAEWLHDNGLLKEIENIVEDAYRLEDDDKYTAAITDLADSVLQYLLNHEQLFYRANENDSRDYTTEYIEENQPRYEFECYGSDDIVTLVENGALSSWDLVSYVENILSYERVYDGAECSRPWGHHDTSVTVENLTKEGHDYLSDSFERNVEGFWQELVDEHADELEVDDDEDEYDDDMDVED